MGGGKSGQGGGTSYQSSSVQIPPEVMARYNAVNTRAEGVANTPWQPYTGELVAPVNQTQQGGINTITGAAGVDTPYFNQATAAINQGLSQATPLYQTGAGQVAGGLAAGNQYTTQGLQTASGAAGASMPFNGLAAGQLNSAYGNTQPLNNAAIGLAAGATGAVNPGELDINRYMSPYNEGVVQSTLSNLRQDQAMDRADLRDQQILGGSFGGDRSGVGNANLQRQQDLAYGNVAAQLYNQNYGQALGAAQQQQGVGLSAGQANRAALASGAQNIAGIGQQQYAQGAATAQGNLGIGQQIYGQGQGLASAQMQGGNQIYNQGVGAAGTNAGLASGLYNMGAGAAGTYGQLGTQQLTNQLTQGQAQIGAGTVQQQTQQAEDTARYEQFLQERGYPFQVAQFLANIAMGTGAQSGSTTNTVATQPQPYFSDERLKENVHVIGKTHDGQPIIRFNYKGDASTQIGLSAQETEKHHPDAVGLASGFKTVDYDAATRDSIAKAGGGGLSTDMAGILAQQRAMFPGAHDPRGIANGVGPHGVAIAPLKATAPQSAKVDMQRPTQQQTGAKQDIDSVLGLYKTGKGMADMYSEGKDTLVGTAGKDGKPGTGGWFGKDGKWSPSDGSASKLFSNDNTGLAGGKVTVENLAPPADPTVAGLAAGVPADPALASSVDPSWLTGTFANRGGRMLRAAGGAMPYGVEGYIPEELYEPVKPDAPDEADRAKMGGPGGGQQGGKKGGVGGAAMGALSGAAMGASIGGPWGAAGGAVLGGLSSLFEKGGRVGLATGGVSGEFSPIPGTEEEIDPLHRLRIVPPPGRGATPVNEAGLAAGAGFPVEIPELPPKDEGYRTAPFELSKDRLPPMSRYVDRTTRGTMVPESGTPGPAEGLAAGQIPPAGGPSGPNLPDGTPIVDTPPTGLAAAPEAGPPPPPPPATGAPALGAGARPTMPAGFTQPGGQHPADAPYDPATYTPFVFGRESNGRNFNNPNWPTAAGGPDGPGQFIPGTWQGFVQARPDLFAGKSPAEIDALRKDPALAAQATQWYADKNSGPLKAAGVPLTNGNLYMAHMLDGPPAAALLANPNMDAVEALKTAGLSDAQARASITKNGGTVGMTAGQFAELHKYKRPSGAPAQAVALNEPADRGAGLATGQPATQDPQAVPDFIDRAGSWIDRNQRPIMAGLAFIGNMLGSKSHQLTGAIGEGLAAAAPMYMATGFKEKELEQSQQRISITERAQYLSVLAQLQAMQSSNVQAGKGRNPEIDKQISQISTLIERAGGVAPVVKPGTGGTGGVTPVRAEQTDLAPRSAPASSVTSTPLPAPGATPTPGTQPTPASNAKDPYAMPAPDPGNAAFRARIHPDMNPDVWRQRSKELADINPTESRLALERAQQLEATMRDKGETVDIDGNVMWVPGFREMQAAKQRMQTNPKYAEEQRDIALGRERLKQQVEALKELSNAYETGSLNSVWSDLDGKLKAVGFKNGLSGGSASQYQEFMKEASAVMLASAQSMPAGHGPTDALRQQIATSFAAPTLDPEANRKIFSKTTAMINWADKNYTDTMKELEDKPWLDTRRYFDDWAKQNDIQKFTKDADRETTTAGMKIPKTMAELEDGRLYNMTPQDVFTLYKGDPNVKREDIVKKFGNRPRVRMRVVTTPDGNRKLVEE